MPFECARKRVYMCGCIRGGWGRGEERTRVGGKRQVGSRRCRGVRVNVAKFSLLTALAACADSITVPTSGEVRHVGQPL